MTAARGRLKSYQYPGTEPEVVVLSCHPNARNTKKVMPKDKKLVSEIALFAAVGALAVSWFMRDDAEVAPEPATMPAGEPPAQPQVKRTLAEFQTRLADLEAKSARAIANVELRLDQQSKRLDELPSTQQIISAMEQLLTRTTAALEQRLTAQAQAIDVLKSAVSTTDSLIERTLEFTKDTLSQRSSGA